MAGGSGGVGVRTCAALAAAGAKVAIVGQSEERLAAAERAVEEAGSEALVIVGDMTAQGRFRRAVADPRPFGRSTSSSTGRRRRGHGAVRAEDYPRPEWDRIVDLNLRTTLLLSQAAVRAMIAAGNGGRILNLTSVRGQLGIDAGYSAYVAAKGA